MNNSKKGKVYIVGAGAGSLDHLTAKALNIISKQAEVVIYDRLISEDIISQINPDADRIFAGKEPKLHHMTQEEINSAIIDNALKGKIVARLKGGDPMIFGRGGEEVDVLEDNKIEYEIIPGITSALLFGAESSVPLTYRNVSDGVIFISGHSYNEEEPNLDWKFLAKGKNTIVIYMGVGNIEIISKRLIENGMNPDIPVAVGQDVGSTKARYLVSNIRNIAIDIETKNIKNPAIIVIGEVVKKSRRIKHL